MAVAALVVSIVGVASALGWNIYNAVRARHRIEVDLSGTQLWNDDGPIGVALVTVRNIGRPIGVEDVDFHWTDPTVPPHSFTVRPRMWAGGSGSALLSGGYLLRDGEVRTWAFDITVDGYAGRASFAVTALLADGRRLRSNDYTLQVQTETKASEEEPEHGESPGTPSGGTTGTSDGA